MMKKGYARGGMKKKMMMAGGASMKKKMMQVGGALKAPGANQTGLKKLPTSVRNNMGYMSKGGQPPLVLPPVLRKAIADKKVKIDSKGNVVMTDAGRRKAMIETDAINKAMRGKREKTMRKKSYAGGGATSDYDITQRMYGGAGKKKTGSTTTGKKPTVTKAMMSKAGVTSLRDFYNKMEVNAAGTGYKKRAKALQRVGAKKKSSDGKQVKSLQGKSSTQVAKVSARNKNKKETQFERLQRLNKEAMAKTGGKSGRLKAK